MRKITILLAAFYLTFIVRATAQVDTQNPIAARDYCARGLIREDAKQFQEAIADYKQAGDLDPAFFDAHFTLSSLYAELKDYRAAIDSESILTLRRSQIKSLNTGAIPKKIPSWTYENQNKFLLPEIISVFPVDVT